MHDLNQIMYFMPLCTVGQNVTEMLYKLHWTCTVAIFFSLHT